MLFVLSHEVLLNFAKTTILYYLSLVVILIFLFIFRKQNIIRLAYIIINMFIFLLTDYSTMQATGIGNYKATIIVDKNSFIKDIVDIEKPLKDGNKEKYTKNYHYKGDHIELKDVKVLSTLGDIAYVELCSENIEISKKLEENCKKTIKVEFIKKDIHIIRDGKKQDATNTKDSSNKTNNENKEQNEQDLEKSKENNKEENTTKNN